MRKLLTGSFALALVVGLWACEQGDPAAAILQPADADYGYTEGPDDEYNGSHIFGAIHTTIFDGSIVNENVHYEYKEDVYLSGGPPPNAPRSAAGLPAGQYFFQVTDPSGKVLLSTDHIQCRRVHVDDDGQIDYVYEGTYQVNAKYGNEHVVEDRTCRHVYYEPGVDHAEVVVQLYPYDDTPNNGGVYKAWMTPVDQYDGPYGAEYIPEINGSNGKVIGTIPMNGAGWEGGNAHGFIPAWSKTDNYKVDQRRMVPPPEIYLKKFHDADYDGVWDADEVEITGWPVSLIDPLGVTSELYTPETIFGDPAGTYTFTEDLLGTAMQTVGILDDVIQSQFVEGVSDADPEIAVEVLGQKDETHTVVYGNVGLGTVKACKVYDSDGDGEADEGEAPVEGFLMKLERLDGTGAVDKTWNGYTGEDGCVTFTGLLPGSYRLTEVLPGGDWTTYDPTSVSADFSIASNLTYEADGTPSLDGDLVDHVFANFCEGEADFGTKGFWHNKNGLELISQADIDFVNGLDPYDDATAYFASGDEPFDGEFGNGDPVAAAFQDATELWAAGTYQAEVSQFLVESVGDGGIQEQLAQQMLAFIFNVQEYTGGFGGSLYVDGSWVSSQSLLDAGIAAWQSPGTEDDNYWSNLFDGLNNNPAVKYVAGEPCEIVYPS